MTTEEDINDQLYKPFTALWADLKTENSYPDHRPLLAHCTSIPTLDRIMVNNELWFSNPLYMNDMEELRFGMREGATAFRKSEKLKAACPHGAYDKLLAQFEANLERFANQDAFDTYVFCMSEHTANANDGLLSMWRGYGGNGSGAAIVFDTGKFEFNQGIDFLVLSDVQYLSHEKRLAWIDAKLSQLADLLKEHPVPEDKLYLPVHAFFQRLKVFSLFTKHDGFNEEKEWRAVYLRDWDTENKLTGMLHYALGNNGIEPKLKLKIEPIAGITQDDFALEQIISQIILGPSISHDLAVMSVRRMLEANSKFQLATNLTASSTPFRPRTSFQT